MSEKKVAVLLVGISGNGHRYLHKIFHDNNGSAYLSGVVDINPKRSDYYQEIKEREIPIYASMEEFYQHEKADLAIISTPIHLHKDQSILAMENGSHVLCEKPITANPEDIKEMIKVRDKTNKFLAIGFNWSFSPSVQQLKTDILNGRFGKAKRLKTIILWPRNEEYYNRSPWVGKKYSLDGDMIFDSVANNATAHFLHHLFYLTGDSIDTSAEIAELKAELYRVNDIETFDTCAVKIKTNTNIDILYIASHAVKNLIEKPQFVLEFEKATITYPEGGDDIHMLATLHDGSTIKYADPHPEDARITKFQVCVDAILNGHQNILCGIEAATPHVQAVYAMHQSVHNVPKFPEKLCKWDEILKLNWVENLDQVLVDCYEKWSIPSERNVDWGQTGKTIQF